MPARPVVLLLGFGSSHDPLAGRILLTNLRPLRADGTNGALAALERSGDPVRALLMGFDHPLGDLAFQLQRFRDRAGVPSLPVVAIGSAPTGSQREEFRKAQADYALIEPFTDHELRFVLNRALYDTARGEARGDLRVPIDLMARVFSAAGEKAALVYNLSVSGAFLETLRPTGVGGRIRVELPLPGAPLLLPAQVVSTNVPGNLQRPNLPMGMGVRFDEPDAASREALAKYVEARVRSFEL